MFSKRSRYKNLNDIVTTDAGGRTLNSKRIRLLPEVSGIFQHTVDQVDRLDHLAFKYYKQPRKWWRFCDANPEFMSPNALLGEEPVCTARFPITYNNNTDTDNANHPPWWELIKNLMGKPGVRAVDIREHAYLVEEEAEHNGRSGKVKAEKFKRTLVVTYNRLNITAPGLKQAIEEENEGFNVGEPEVIERAGKKIIIPPDVIV